MTWAITPMAVYHHHGPVAFVMALACWKFVKFRILCWRRAVVNKEVHQLTRQRLHQHELSSAAGEENTVAICVACGCPLWLRTDEDDRVVRLVDCGCAIHFGCLLDVATQQHGIEMPECKTDFDRVWCVLRRLFGIDAVKVEGLQCPCCKLTNSSWEEAGKDAVVTLNSPAAKGVVSALRRGHALRLSSLQSVLLSTNGTTSPELKQWQAAARRETSLRAMLKEVGQRSSIVLTDLLEPLPENEDNSESDMELFKLWPVHRRGADKSVPDPGALAGSCALIYVDFLWGPA